MVERQHPHRQLDKVELRAGKPSRKDFLKVPRHPVYVALDSLKCAHNIGTIFRLSDALLVKKIYLCGDTAVPPKKKIKSSSRGAEKWVPWEYREDIVPLMTALKSKGVFILSSEISTSSVNYYDAEITLPVCLVLGSENNGIRDEVLNLSDCVVHLPVFGMLGSINVAATSSVLLYEIVRRLIAK